MIRVQRMPEYASFNDDVRKKGANFLRRYPNPSASQFRRHNYWKEALVELHSAYKGMCAYTTRQLVTTGSVDHFKPKSMFPSLAYEWSNYRLARQSINSRKGNSIDVADPFDIKNGWFVLDLPSCLIKPGRNLPKEIRDLVFSTIKVLRLNDDEKLVEERNGLLVHLADKEITMSFLDSHYPFLSSEIKRQGVEGSLKTIFSRP